MSVSVPYISWGTRLIKSKVRYVISWPMEHYWSFLFVLSHTNTHSSFILIAQLFIMYHIRTTWKKHSFVLYGLFSSKKYYFTISVFSICVMSYSINDSRNNQKFTKVIWQLVHKFSFFSVEKDLPICLFFCNRNFKQTGWCNKSPWAIQ